MAQAIGSIRIVLAVFALLLAAAGQARANYAPGPGSGWLTIASRSNVNDAIALARHYSGEFPGAVVFESSSGFYGVTLGWSNIADGTPLLESLKASGRIPSDSYFTAGSRFLRPVWSISNAHVWPLQDLLAATRIQTGGAQASRNVPSSSMPGYVTNLRADDFLSLRTGPGTSNSEIARMRPNTALTIVSALDDWYEVSLPNGMRGWASAKYIAPGVVAAPAPVAPPPTVGPVPEVGPEPNRQQVAPPSQERSEDVAAAPQPQPERQKPAVVGVGKRVALVVGNSAYQHTVQLPNPRNDAEAIAARLTELGFAVTTSLDGAKADMEKAVRDFVRAMDGSEVALFFYAGHGMQVRGVNYLIPIDAKLEDGTALDFETINLDTVLGFMNEEDRVSIVLLDACRDNPLSRTFARSLGATRSAFIGRGLAAPQAGSGETLIGFATAPGEVALDGEGSNSPFTTALLNNIGTQGLEIELMLKRVKQEVYDTTGRKQEPWHNSALRREFYFNPAE